jgi:hypothetical protein
MFRLVIVNPDGEYFAPVLNTEEGCYYPSWTDFLLGAVRYDLPAEDGRRIADALLTHDLQFAGPGARPLLIAA